MSDEDDEFEAVVICTGPCSVKAGIAGEDVPAICFPCAISRSAPMFMPDSEPGVTHEEAAEGVVRARTGLCVRARANGRVCMH